MKPKRAELGQLRLGQKFFEALCQRLSAHLAVVPFKISVGILLGMVEVLHQCYNLHISLPLLLMCMKCSHPRHSANATNCATYVASTHNPKYFFGFFCANSAVWQPCARIPKGLQCLYW